MISHSGWTPPGRGESLVAKMVALSVRESSDDGEWTVSKWVSDIWRQRARRRSGRSVRLSVGWVVCKQADRQAGRHTPTHTDIQIVGSLLIWTTFPCCACDRFARRRHVVRVHAGVCIYIYICIKGTYASSFYYYYLHHPSSCRVYSRLPPSNQPTKHQSSKVLSPQPWKINRK